MRLTKTTLFDFIKNHTHGLTIWVFVAIVAVFFYRTIFFTQLPVPSDDLVGLYHPWRDAYAHAFQNGVPFKNFLITDPIRQQIPWRKQVIDAWKAGKAPLWNAYDFSGTPLLGNIQSGALYPMNIVFFVFPFEIAWSLLIISQPLLAGIFLYLFLRHKHIEPLASLVGAIMFALSGFSIAWLTWGTIVSTILWLPLALYSFDEIHTGRKKWPWRLLFIWSVISSFFAGHLQIFFYGMLLFVAYAVGQQKAVKRTKLSVMHVMIPCVILLMTAPVWMRLIPTYMASSRMEGVIWTNEGFFIPIRHLVQFIAPDYFGNPTTLNYWGTWNYGEMIGYIGVIGLAFAFIGMSRITVFWVGTIICCLVFAVDGPIARLPYVLHIPFLSSLQPTRLMGIIDFSLSILAAYGFSSILKNEKKKIFRIGVAVIGILLVGLWGSVSKPELFHISTDQLMVAKRNLILPTILYGVLVGMTVLLQFIRSSWYLIRILCCVVFIAALSFELIRFGWKFTPFTEDTYFFPKTDIIETLEQMKKPFRVLATDDRLVPPNVFGFYGIESVSGYDPIYTSRYEEFIAAMERGEPNIQPPFGFNRIIAPKTITSPLFSLLNVHFIVAMDTITSSNVRLLSEEGTTKLYSVVQKTPRIYFADGVLFETTKQNVMNRLYDPSFIGGQTAIVESQPFSVGAQSTSDTLKMTVYEGDHIEIQTMTEHIRFMVVGNMMDKHWRVFIDGKEASIYRTNYLFFGFLVPDGTHQIKVQYR